MTHAGNGGDGGSYKDTSTENERHVHSHQQKLRDLLNGVYWLRTRDPKLVFANAFSLCLFLRLVLMYGIITLNSGVSFLHSSVSYYVVGTLNRSFPYDNDKSCIFEN